jgi:hypothetical protein
MITIGPYSRTFGPLLLRGGCSMVLTYGASKWNGNGTESRLPAGSPSLSSGFTLDTGALVEREGALEKNVARDRTLPLLRVGWRVPPHVPAIQEVVRLCRLRPYGDAWVSLFEVPLLPVPQVEPHCEPPVARTSRSGPNLVTYLRRLVRQYSVCRGCDGR